jgi:hypothetical protein
VVRVVGGWQVGGTAFTVDLHNTYFLRAKIRGGWAKKCCKRAVAEN